MLIKFNCFAATSANSLLQPSFEFENCITYATCFSSYVETDCMISYSSVSDSGTASGELNDRFALPLLDPNTAYDFITNITINSTLMIEVQTLFPTGNCEIYF